MSRRPRTRDDCSLIAFVIPGNPVSHFVTFHVAIRLALECLEGGPQSWPLARVELATDLAHMKNLELLRTGQPGSFRLSGELDLLNVEAVSRYLQEELRTGQQLTLDVSGLTFIDSKGLAMLLQLAASSLELGFPPVVLRSPSEVLRRVLEVGLPSPIPGIQLDS